LGSALGSQAAAAQMAASWAATDCSTASSALRPWDDSGSLNKLLLINKEITARIKLSFHYYRLESL